MEFCGFGESDLTTVSGWGEVMPTRPFVLVWDADASARATSSGSKCQCVIHKNWFWFVNVFFLIIVNNYVMLRVVNI